jgi:hypothetical protein
VAPSPITAIAGAPVPDEAVADGPVLEPAFVKLNVGADVYPVPPSTIFIDATPPLLTLKVPVHPLPPPPVIINGNIPSVCPEPPKMEFAPVIPDVMVIVGIVIYPVPAFVITKEVIKPIPELVTEILLIAPPDIL